MSTATKKKTAKQVEKKPETVLVLRTCDKNGRGYGGFQWPKSGYIEAPDWKPIKDCGNGLHGLLWGAGDGGYLNWDDDAVWMVVEVEKNLILDIGGKVKYPSGKVLVYGDRKAAVEYISSRAPAGTPVTCGTATAGYCGTATAGYCGTATAGYCGTATAGNRGTATAGNRGTATAGDSGTATAGDSGTATAGYCGTATAGYCGTLIFKWWDRNADRVRFAIFYVGENDIKPNTKYRFEDGKITEVK